MTMRHTTSTGLCLAGVLSCLTWTAPPAAASGAAVITGQASFSAEWFPGVMSWSVQVSDPTPGVGTDARGQVRTRFVHSDGTVRETTAEALCALSSTQEWGDPVYYSNGRVIARITESSHANVPVGQIVEYRVADFGPRAAESDWFGSIGYENVSSDDEAVIEQICAEDSTGFNFPATSGGFVVRGA